ncbi:hypothetical protein [Nitrosopumilus sp. b2]|uniref:hypothetical protein n=1 Tax=Nitrosopumilus sp. b2 TaxID=2109908 RepID=UPI001C70FB48|nr:hypothetical protein [Nitrosopumilus sp. b2]
MGVNLVKYILDAEKSPISLHDLKIHLFSNLHKFLVEQGYPVHTKNQMIKLEMKSGYASVVKFSIYPNTITIDIGCSNCPISYLPAGAVRLSELISEILSFLCIQSSHRAQIDPIEKWMLMHYHKNQDGKITYNSEMFHILLEDALGKITRAYSKKFQDGSIFVRIEEIGNKKIHILKLLESMRNGNTEMIQ